jgi:hypothetical protein
MKMLKTVPRPIETDTCGENEEVLNVGSPATHIVGLKSTHINVIARRFALVPGALWVSGFSHISRSLYGVILTCYRPGHVFEIGDRTLAELVECGRTRLREARNELLKAEWIKVEAGPFGRSRYTPLRLAGRQALPPKPKRQRRSTRLSPTVQNARDASVSRAAVDEILGGAA